MPYCAWCGSRLDNVSYAPCPLCDNPCNGAPKPIVRKEPHAKLIIGGAATTVLLFLIGFIVLSSRARDARAAREDRERPSSKRVLAFAKPPTAPAPLPDEEVDDAEKQKRTMNSIRTMANSLVSYHRDHKRYPAADALESELIPKYAREILDDAWGNPLQYTCWNDGSVDFCTEYAVGSPGRDGAFLRGSVADYTEFDTIITPDGDIVMRNGKFIQQPAADVEP
ncbi:MAG TPA: hypothetical protein VF057_11990 [Thermoanaerobaculia bacterium]